MPGRVIIPFVAFFLIANPMTYKITRSLAGGIASPEGLPTQVGVLLHAIVFVLLVKLLMRMYRPSGYTPGISSLAWIAEDQTGSLKYNRKR